MADITQDDKQLLKDLGVEVEVKEAPSRTPREERVIAGFEEIQRFFEENNRAPQHGEDRDIFERLYAIRLDRIRSQEDCRALVEPFDTLGLLKNSDVLEPVVVDDLDDEELLAELGIDDETSSITDLRHVRSSADKRAAEEIANREPCADFDKFKPLFDKVNQELEAGVRITSQIRKKAGFLKTDIKKGEFFILSGQMLYVEELGAPIKAPNGQNDARLRVIYSNSTESNILLRSLQRALYKDEASRMISDPTMAGPLFSSDADQEDLASGTVYVLRSKSDLPLVQKNHAVLHKIGVTGGKVEARITNAKLDPTFLMADVEIVATYELFNINRTKFEKIIHRIFGDARLDIEIKDRFGHPVIPREWFLMPLHVIDQAIELIKEGKISDYKYDLENARLIRHGE